MEMVNEILRERDRPGFGEKSEYGSRMGGRGGIEVQVYYVVFDLFIFM